MNTTATSTGNGNRQARSNQYAIGAWKPLLVFILFALAISVASNFIFQRYKENIKNQKQGELGGIAELKTRQIISWMTERRSDAQALTDDSLFLATVDHWLQQGGPAGETRVKLTGRLASLQQAYAAYGYTSISLFDDQAMLRLSSSADEAPIQGEEKVRLLESMRTGQIGFSDIHREKLNSEERVAIELSAPLTLVKNGKVRTIGAVLFRMDPSLFLFPLIKRWPTPSPSAENLLVRRDGGEVVFLNELRHRNNTPLAMRLPLSQQQLPATMAAMGKEGLAEGVDYRGVPVVSVLSKVPGSSWLMVSKIDKAEIYAPINQLANWLVVMMLALIGAGGGIAVFWRNKEKKQYENELDHQRLTKHLDYLVKYANDIILLLDSAGKIADFNDRALEAYGYSAEELSGLNIDDLRAIDFTPPSAERFRQIDQSGGALVFESTHIRRNGANFPVEASVRQIDIAGGKFYQAIIRDITERKLAESELARQKKFIRQVIDSNPNLIFVKDAGGRFLLANEAMAKSYGQTTGGVVGKYNYELVHNPEQAAAYDKANREVFEKRQEVVAIETATLADGKNHWFKTIRKPLEQDDGTVSVLTIAMDITELKEAEEKQQNLNRSLRLLSSCNAALAHAENEEQLIEVCKLIVEMGGYRMAWVGYAEDDKERTVRPVMQYGFAENYLERAKISWGDTERGRGPTGSAIRSGVTQVNQNFLDNPLLTLWREAALARGYQSSIALPLTSGARAFGALTIYSATPDSFNSDEVILLQELADNLALGITALRMRTEHELAVERLRQSEEHFRFLTENATDMIYIMSLPSGRYDYVSPSSTHLTGYTQRDFYSTPRLMQTIIHPDWHAYCEEQWEKLLLGEIPAHFEFQIIHKSGDTRWIHQRNAPIWGDGESEALVAIQGVVTDVTEQKQAAEQRQQQKNFLQQIIDTDPNLIYVTDATGKFLMVNQALADLYGMAMQDMIGKSDEEINPDQEEIPGFFKSGHETLRNGGAVVSTESILMPDDKQHWYLTIKKPLIQPDGSVSVLGIGVDISAQKRSELKLARSYRKLQQLYLHLENVKAEERARIALNLHDEMGATLAAIKMSIAWLASKLPSGMPQLAAEVAHLTKLVSDGIQTMRQTVTQLNPGRLDDIGLMAAIRDYVKKFQQHTNIESLLTLPNDELALDANQSATIFRIIQESLNNVVKHAQASEVHILLKKRGKSLLLTVEDNGIGLNPDEHKKQAFGLLGIRERALMVGGKARITSQPGKGTQVSVNIPLTPENNPSDTV